MSGWQAALLAAAIVVAALILRFDAGRSRDRTILRARRREQRRRERDDARREAVRQEKLRRAARGEHVGQVTVRNPPSIPVRPRIPPPPPAPRKRRR